RVGRATPLALRQQIRRRSWTTDRTSRRFGYRPPQTPARGDSLSIRAAKSPSRRGRLAFLAASRGIPLPAGTRPLTHLQTGDTLLSAKSARAIGVLRETKPRNSRWRR